MSDEIKDSDDVKAFTERLHNDFLPKLAHPKLSPRNTMAITMLAIVDRQILHKETDTADEWERLRATVKDNPPVLAMVGNLQGVLKQYEADLQKQIQDGADETRTRKTASGLIKMAIMSKMRKANPGEATGGFGTGGAPAAKVPAATKPAAMVPVAKKPVAKKPAAKKPAAKKPAAKKASRSKRKR